VLVGAAAIIRRDGRRAADFSRALALLRPYLDAPMSPHQRLRAHFLAAMARAALGEYDAALLWLDTALQPTRALRQTSDVPHLYRLRAAIHRALLRFADATDDLRTGYALLLEEAVAGRPLEPTFALDLRVQLAGSEFFLAHYDLAQEQLGEILPLLTYVPARSPEAATVDWLHAHLLRAAGLPEHALPHALTAADIYTELGTPASAARIQTLVAETRLDLAERLPPGTAHERAVVHAWPHVQLALGLAKEAGDPQGLGLARLTRARYGRLRGANENRLERIERVVRLGRQLDDEAIIAQAFTALGDELRAHGETEAAIYRYRDALGVLDGSDVPAVGRGAQRELLLAEEFRDD